MNNIFVASITNETIELDAIEVAKNAFILKTNMNVEQLVQVMFTQMQALLSHINGD